MLKVLAWISTSHSSSLVSSKFLECWVVYFWCSTLEGKYVKHSICSLGVLHALWSLLSQMVIPRLCPCFFLLFLSENICYSCDDSMAFIWQINRYYLTNRPSSGGHSHSCTGKICCACLFHHSLHLHCRVIPNHFKVMSILMLAAHDYHVKANIKIVKTMIFFLTLSLAYFCLFQLEAKTYPSLFCA